MTINISIAHNILNSNLLQKNTEDSVNAVKYNSSSMFFTPSTEVEVVRITKGLNNEKPTGIDEFS
jgi:hypothetical protein